MVKKRNEYIDFVKCVMIMLMIAFHLVYIGNTYAGAKAFVYTFHMPCFLIISGYLLNMSKSLTAIGRSMGWILLPYMVMETAYIAGAAVLPIREHIDNLTVCGYLDMLFLHPIGPYWYLHTLVICSLACKIIHDFTEKNGIDSQLTCFLMMSLVLFLLSKVEVVALSSCLYFMIGVVLRSSETKFQQFFQASWLAVLLLCIMAVNVADPDRFSLAGMVIVYFAMSSTLSLHVCIEKYAPRLNALFLFIGRNTLLLLLFSPIFTILAKIYQPFLLKLEPSGMCFMVISVAFAIAGSLAIGWVMDRLHISRWFFGRTAINR